jgi:uncharacterized protein YukE
MIPASGGGSGFQGLKDVSKARHALEQLTQAKTKLRNAKDEADQAVAGLAQHWHGPDAERFQNSWKKDTVLIEKCLTDVTAMKKTLDAEIQEQKATSA